MWVICASWNWRMTCAPPKCNLFDLLPISKCHMKSIQLHVDDENKYVHRESIGRNCTISVELREKKYDSLTWVAINQVTHFKCRTHSYMYIYFMFKWNRRKRSEMGRFMHTHTHFLKQKNVESIMLPHWANEHSRMATSQIITIANEVYIRKNFLLKVVTFCIRLIVWWRTLSN